MSLNPAALILLVVGFVAVVVGVKGTQASVGQLVTGVPAGQAATGSPMGVHPSAGVPSPAGTLAPPAGPQGP